MKKIKLRSEPTELFKVLKFEGLASSGGEAKSVIGEGRVRVNGQIETRKRRKILVGDILSYADEKYLICLVQAERY